MIIRDVQKDIWEHEKSNPQYALSKFTDHVVGKEILPARGCIETTPRILWNTATREFAVDSFIVTYPCIQTIKSLDHRREYYILRYDKLFNLQDVDLRRNRYCVEKRISAICEELCKASINQNSVFVVPKVCDLIDYDIIDSGFKLRDLFWGTPKYSIIYLETEENYQNHHLPSDHKATLDPLWEGYATMLIKQVGKRKHMPDQINYHAVYEALLAIDEPNIYKTSSQLLNKMIRLHKKHNLGYMQITTTDLLLTK